MVRIRRAGSSFFIETPRFEDCVLPSGSPSGDARAQLPAALVSGNDACNIQRYLSKELEETVCILECLKSFSLSWCCRAFVSHRSSVRKRRLRVLLPSRGVGRFSSTDRPAARGRLPSSKSPPKVRTFPRNSWRLTLRTCARL